MPRANFRAFRKETQDRSVPLRSKEKTQRIDLGLALLSRVAVPGVQYTYGEIAGWAGCTDEGIRRIEKKALGKLQKALGVSDIVDPIRRMAQWAS